MLRTINIYLFLTILLLPSLVIGERTFSTKFLKANTEKIFQIEQRNFLGISNVDWVLTSDSTPTTEYNCEQAIGISKGDCEALVSFYDEAGGVNWNNRTGWLVNNMPCSWYGIKCIEDRVTEIDLPRNGLSGPIPTALGQLTSLRILNLTRTYTPGNDSLSGEIPSELSQLSNLVELALDYNQLTGRIPTELATLSNLEVLSLFGNQLSGEIPPELGQLSNLARLNLAANQLSGQIPIELTGLTKLWSLMLYSNQLGGEIPPEIGNLNLRNLGLGTNGLSGEIPPELGQMISLRSLNLQSSKLSGTIPSELGQLTYIQWLRLGENQLSGEIPPEFGQLVNVSIFDLSRNRLSGGIPEEFALLSNLTRLSLSNNFLDDPISEALGCALGLKPRESVDIGYNQLTAATQQAADCLDNQDADWQTTQTIPPNNLQASAISHDTIRLSWEPILYDASPYTTNSGFYEIGIATNDGSTYDIVAQTRCKRANEIKINGLDNATSYTFAVRTFTRGYLPQYRPSTSGFSHVVSATTFSTTYYQYLPLMYSQLGQRFSSCPP